MDLIGQSLALAEKSCLPPGLVPRMLSGFFANPAIQDHVIKIGERDFDTVGFTAAGGLKDIQLMIAAAAVDLRPSNAEAMRAKLDAAIARGWRDRDWSGFTEIDRARRRFGTPGPRTDRPAPPAPSAPSPHITDRRHPGKRTKTVRQSGGRRLGLVVACQDVKAVAPWRAPPTPCRA
jgi:hypothetical protein